VIFSLTCIALIITMANKGVSIKKAKSGHAPIIQGLTTDPEPGVLGVSGGGDSLLDIA
jgi:hypothetical protein